MAGKSRDNEIENVRPYILHLMREDERDFGTCELCGNDIPFGEFVIHHTKYEAATYYDLRIVCRSCDKKPENRLLD